MTIPIPPNLPAGSTLVDVLTHVEATTESLRLEVIAEREARQKDIRLSEERVQLKTQAIRRGTIALAVAVAVAAGLIAALFFLLAQAKDQRQQICELSNERALSIRDGFKSFTDALIGFPPSSPRTPEAQAEFDGRAQAFREYLNNQLAPLSLRDCSN